MSTMDKATVRKLAREIKSIAKSASLTGSLRKGSRILAESYNKCLDALTAQGDTLAAEIFPVLNAESAHIDEVGAAAALLYGYLSPDDAKHRRSHDDDDDDDDID